MQKHSGLKRSIIITIDSMSGAIDWILPVCKYLNDRYNDVDMYFVLLRYDKEQIFNNNVTLKTIVFELSNNRCYDLTYFFPLGYRLIRWVLCTVLFFSDQVSRIAVAVYDNTIWNFYGKKRVKRWVDILKPTVILRDGLGKPSHACEVFVKAVRTHESKVVSFPTAPSFTFAPDMWIQRKNNVIADNKCFADYAIVDKDWDAKYCNKYFKETVTVGTPKFDKRWIAYLQSRYAEGDRKGDKQSNSIVVLLKNEMSLIFKHIDFRGLLEEMLDTLLSVTDYRVILKPHPRQNIMLLSEILKKYPQGEISVSYEPSFKIISGASYVVAMPSGVILDALMIGRPVIEYFNFKKLNAILLELYHPIPKNIFGGMSFLDGDGYLTSVFRGKGLVIPADTPNELALALSELKIDEAKIGIAKAREIFFECKIEKAVKFVMNLLDRN